MNARAGLVVSVAWVGLLGSQALGEERVVPSPNYPTIQSAIDACSDGDEVVIEPNTYTGAGNRDLDFGGRAITVRSTDPDDANVVAATIIDAEGAGRGFIFQTNEGLDSVIAGLTIINGHTYERGGGICCEQSGPTITKCTISGCTAAEEGGGVSGCRGLIHDCQIIDNTASGQYMGSGGGIFGGSGTISNCLIAGNEASTSYSYTLCSGGGVSGFSGTIMNCLIVGNAAVNGAYEGGAAAGGGLSFVDGTVINCTIVHNEAMGEDESSFPPVPTGVGGGIFCHNGQPDVVNTIVWGNSANAEGPDIYPTSHPTSYSYVGVDPLLEDPDGDDNNPSTWDDNDYHLSSSSPCINAGDPNGDYTGQTDIDGQKRVMSGRVDIGSDERHLCGNGLAPVLPMTIAVLGMSVLMRRRG